MSARTGPTTPDALDDAQLALHAAFAGGDRAAQGTDFSLVDADGALLGPPATWLLSPRLGAALEPLGGVIRFGLELPARAKEIVILQVAHDEQSPFERYAHIRAARAAGLTDDEIDAVLEGTTLDLVDEQERAIHELATLLIAGGQLRDADFDRAVAALGRPAVFEVVTLVGYYRMIALQLRAFDIQPPQHHVGPNGGPQHQKGSS